MNLPSSFLIPSSSNRSEVAPLKASSSSMLLMDVVPFEAALQRLFYEKIRTDEQLSGYGTQQAYRGLLYAVRAGTLPLKDTTTGSTTATGAPSASPVGRATSSARIENGKDGASSYSSVKGSSNKNDPNMWTVRGWQAVLYKLSLAAARSAEDMECAVFLSVRILCDPASAYGEGNERPCCTAEWTQALLHGLPLDGVSTSQGDLDAHFCHLVQANHRYQLGFLILMSNTLRMVATGRVGDQHLCSNYSELFQGAATQLLPRVARYVEESLRDAEEADALVASGDPGSLESIPPPSRLSVELNHFVIHNGYWLAMDALSAHTDAEDNGEQQEGETGNEQLKKQTKKKRPLVLDRDQPAYLWGCVTLVRNALCHALNWIKEEALREKRKADMNTKSGAHQSSSGQSVALLQEVSQQLKEAFTDVVKKQEYLQNALLNASRAFNGAATRDVHSLTAMAWGHTLRMCFFLCNVTGAWVNVHGGLGYHVLCADQVLPGYRNILMCMASSLLRIPAVETKRAEEERDVLLALDAALCALLTLVSAAPTSNMQVEVWSSDSTVTQQVHALLVQRALRYRNDRVLKLASLLSRAILDSAVQNGALAGFATDSADQLLEFLESDDDAASRCVGELLSVAILQHPYRLVPALFRLLQHGSAATRRHVLRVLFSLPDLLSDGAESSSPCLGEDLASDTQNTTTASAARTAAVRRRDVLRLLAEHLLLQIQDEELCVRMLSSSLFTKVHPADVLQPLLNLCVQRDSSGRKQSAAIAALTSVLTAHTDNAATYVLLLQSAYECHNSVKVASTGLATSKLPKLDVEQTEDRPSARPPVHRPVPQTPGDILLQALLYSTVTDPAAEEGDGVSEETDNGERETPKLNATLQASNSSSSPSLDSARRREAHLNTAVLTLTDRWVHAALPTWTQERHSCLLMQCLAHEAFGHASPYQAVSTPEVNVENRVQFFLKYILRSTSVVTGAAAPHDSNTTVNTEDISAARTCHILAIWDAFFAEREMTSGEKTGVPVWSAVIESDEKTLSESSQGSAQATSRVHAALLPLLCLRGCDRGTFASARLVDNVVQDYSATTGSDPQSETTSAANETAVILKKNKSLAAAENVYDQIVSALWHSLWSAVTHTEATSAFFTLYPDIQRVLLEVLCRFPAVVFFAQWHRWKKATVTDDNNNASFQTNAQSLFVYRVYIYGMSAYLAASLANESSVPSTQSTPTDLEVVLQHRHTLLHMLSTVLPHWLMEDCRETVDANESAEGSLEAAKQRLCMTAMDAGGVLGVVSLAYPLRPHASPSGVSSVEHDVVKQELASTSDELLRASLCNLTLAYRSTEAEKQSKSTISTDVGVSATSEPPWAVLLTRFQLCLRMHASLLRTITMNPCASQELLLLWFRHFLSLFIELSNAACKCVVGRTTHSCRAAVDACGAVFQAVLMARKMDDATTAAASSSASPSKGSSMPILCRLAWEEKDALVSFSIGCTRFSKSAAVQTMGVRLLSSLLVAAPEIFLEVSPQHDGKDKSVANAAGGDALQTAAAALQSIALMHADRPTRLLAEEVLRMLKNAYSTTDVVS